MLSGGTGIVLQVIFFLTMYPVLFILYFAMKGAGSAQNGYCFSCRMKADWMKDADVQAVIEKYAQGLKRTLWVLALIPAVTFFVPWFSVSFSIWMIWLCAVIAAPGVPYVQADSRIKALKLEKGWSTNSSGPARTELKNAGMVRRVKVGEFMVPSVISGIAAVVSFIRIGRTDYLELGIIVVIFALTTPLFYAVAVWMDRQKTEVICSDSEVNLNYARAKKNIWKNLWLVSAWENTACTVFFAVVLGWNMMSTGAVLWVSIAYSVLICITMFFALKKVFALEDVYKEKRDIVPEDDDAHWIWGIFYYNKNDRHTMVSRRVGLGTTMNMATTAGKVMTALGIAGLLVIPASCIWIMLEEFTPLQLSVENEVLVAEHLGVDYEIPLADVEEITLVNELPHRTKLNGSAMDNLCKGTFRVSEEGKCQLFLNPQNGVFMRIEAGDVIYYMSAPDDEGTMEIYEVLVGE